jgi:hypothetical protein
MEKAGENKTYVRFEFGQGDGQFSYAFSCGVEDRVPLTSKVFKSVAILIFDKEGVLRRSCAVSNLVRLFFCDYKEICREGMDISKLDEFVQFDLLP